MDVTPLYNNPTRKRGTVSSRVPWPTPRIAKRILNVYAETLRVKRFQRAEELAQKAIIKVMFPTLLCIFPGIFIVILGPEAIQVYKVFSSGVLGD